MDVLLVEDEALVREMLTEDLADAGLQVVPVPCAEEGLAVAEQDGPPPVLVTDVNLGPGMNGVALASEVMRRWPGVAVLVMTGDERNLAAMPGALREQCFVKPFNPPKLVAAVRRAIRR